MCGVAGGECRSFDLEAVGEDESACLEEKSERVMALHGVSKKNLCRREWIGQNEPHRLFGCLVCVNKKERRGSFT